MAKGTERRHEVVVGIFVLGGVLAAMVLVIAIGSQQHLFEGRYRIRTVFGNVSGLRAGSPVYVAGVDVGSVDRVSFVSPSTRGEEGIPNVGKVEVVLALEKRFSPQIRNDSVATIGSVGLLGDKSVDISVGSPTAPEVQRGGYINSQDPLTLNDLLDRIEPIREKFDKILTDISVVTGKVADENAPVPMAIKSASEILAKIDRGEGTLGKLVNDPRLEDRFDTALGNANELILSARAAFDQIRVATTELPATMAAARKVSEDVAQLSSSLRESSEKLPVIVDDLSVVVANLRRASSDLPLIAEDARRGVKKATNVFDAAGRSFLLRGYMDDSKPKLPMALDRVDISPGEGR
jgi:phospholipid/cholesterol/gamma-HCH transport system substrate-binding protein